MPNDGQRGDAAGGDGGSPDPFRPVIPDHELLRSIGVGAFGEVWLARSLTGAYRAVKIVRRDSLHGEGFEREFRGIQRFEPISRAHPNLVNILHVGENRAAGHFFYVMELADDAAPTAEQVLDPATYEPMTVQSKLQQRGGLPFDECLEIALSLSASLIYLHGQRLIHRDIKPANIIFVGGEAKLADIGLVTNTDTAFTFVGTDGFVPREGPGQPQADIYSLGKVLYEMVTGLDRKFFPQLPEGWAARPEKKSLQKLNDIIQRACEADVRLRYQTAEDLRVDLWRLRSSGSGLLSRVSVSIGKLGLTALVLLLMASAAFVLQRWAASRAQSAPSSGGVIPMSDQEWREGFKALFNGKDLAGWDAPGTNWSCVNGTLARINSGGDITYESEQLPDYFELRFDWKLSPGSDSGVLYRPGRVEYQVLDNKSSPLGRDLRTRAGSLFDLFGSPNDSIKPTGQWNESRILCEPDRVRHYLNGDETVNANFNQPEWEEARTRLQAKYNTDLNARRGYLVLRDEQGPVWYRNIRLKKLEAQ